MKGNESNKRAAEAKRCVTKAERSATKAKFPTSVKTIALHMVQTAPDAARNNSETS
jgi:hypothetical protein